MGQGHARLSPAGELRCLRAVSPSAPQHCSRADRERSPSCLRSGRIAHDPAPLE